MHTPREVFSNWKQKALSNPERFQVIGATFKFVVNGPEGGVWRVACRDPVQITEGEGAAECTVEMNSVDFIELANRRLNPQIAFFSGKIKLDGDIGLAMRLGDLM